MSTILERILKLLAAPDITPLVHEHAEVRTIDQARVRAAQAQRLSTSAVVRFRCVEV